MSDETTTRHGRHEPMVMETVVLAPDDQRTRSEHVACRSCWTETQSGDGVRSSLARATWPCEVARLRERVAVLTKAGTHALDSLADIACVHGREFDSNEYADWDSYCSVCAAMRPLAAALTQADDGGRS